MKNNNGFSVLLRTVLIVFCTLAAFGAVLSGFFKYTVRDTEKIADKVVDSAFVDTVYGFCLSDLESQCLYLVLPYEDLAKCVDREDIRRLLTVNCSGALSAVLNNGEFVPAPYDSARFKGAVDAYLDSYVKEHAVTVTEGTSEKIAAELTDTVSARLSVVNTKYIDVIRNIKSLSAALGILSSGFIPLLIVTAVLIVLLIILYRKNIVYSVYYILTACWAGSVMIFVPVILLKLYNLPDKLILSHSTIKVFLANAISVVSDSLTLMSALLFAVFSLSLIIVYSLRGKSGKK